jgi:hypothetical protein
MTAPLRPDSQQLAQFVDALFRHATDGFVSARAFFDDDQRGVFKINSFPWKQGGGERLISIADEQARAAAKEQRPVVCCLLFGTLSNAEHARNKDLKEGLTLSVEIDQDPKAGLARLEELLGTATATVASGGIFKNGDGSEEDKLHGHWRLAHPADDAEAKANLKQARALAMRIIGSDPSGVPMVHPFRWPGSWHRKKEPRLCRLVALHPEIEIDLDKALEVLSAAAPSKDKKKSSKENKSGGDETDKSPSGLFFGQCAALFEQGRSLDEIEQEFAEHPERHAETSASRYIEEGRLREQIEACQQKWREHHREYRAGDDGIWWLGPEETVQLANFNAEIIEDVKLDDGSGVTQRQFVVDGSLGRAALGRVEIAADEFSTMRWLAIAWGARPRITPGSFHKERVADAIKMFSSAARRSVYTHLGWRRIDGEWVYLHAGGGIGADGAVDSVEVKVDNALGQVRLPPVSNLRRAMRASLDFLEVAPEPITYPLWGAIYRAPLGEFAPVTVVPWLLGPTGVLKTSVALLAQAHYAPAVGARPLTNWASTANNNEKLAFLAKDCLLLIDDFCPRGSATDVSRMHGAADRLLRAAANRSGRGRMNADLSLRPEMYPRGLLLGTGEDLPRGHSLRARIVAIAVAAEDVDLERLTDLQHKTELLGQAMSGYISWLTEQDHKRFVVREHELRAEGGGGGHLRTPENFASLQLGVETGLRFAVDCGALTEAQALEHETAAAREMQRLARAQDRLLRSESPADRFVRLLGSVLSSGRGHVTTLDGDEPASAALLGWRKVGSNREGEPIRRGQGHQIGWVDKDKLYLDPDAAYAEVQDMARSHQTSIELTQETLWKRLDDAGLLETDEGRHTVRVTTGDGRKRALCLPLKRLFAPAGEVVPFPAAKR